MRDRFLVTCEHGGNRIPARYRPLFANWDARLDSHRGYDAGALVMARQLAAALNAPLVTSTVSRLLVDLNRSVGHPRHFSAATLRLPAAMRAEIVERHYRPYRDEVERIVARTLAAGSRAIHISVHSFTPRLHGVTRTADVGLLYDPSRRGETQLSARWRAALAARAPALRVRRNYPYIGSADGLMTALRRRFPADAYVGIEVEINQAIVFTAGRPWAALRGLLVDSLIDTRGAARAARAPLSRRQDAYPSWF